MADRSGRLAGKGTAWVEPGEALQREELEAAERSQGVRLGEGDLVLLRTGHARKRLDEGSWDAANAKAGVHTTAMPLFHQRRVAAIGFDGDGEAVPSNCEG
jgi:kynurenine formamidase